EVPNTGSWETFESAEADLSSVTGIHTVYLVSSDNGTYNGDVDWIEFSADSTADSDTVADTGADTDIPWDTDNSNFTNPVIWEDLADCEVIRVDDTFYYTASTMHYSPGAPVLRSYDLVNWEYAGHSVPSLDWGNKYNMDGDNAYVNGIWASTLQYRPDNKTFYWLGCVDFLKTYVYTATSIDGPWEAHSTINNCYYDAGLFIDDDNKMYVAYGNSKIYVAELSSDGKSQVGTPQMVYDSGNVTLEGSRFFKHEGSYYILLTRPPNAEFVLRSTNGPLGPYTIQTLVDNVSSPIQGGGAPHQGGFVNTSKGDWYYMAFVDAYPGGRMPVLAPVTWANGWPSVQLVNGGWGSSYPHPDVPAHHVVRSSVGTDTFTGTALRPEWEWNHNPVNTSWSLNNGLVLKTATVTNDIYSARNTLTRRIRGPKSTATIKMDISQMADGDRAGLAVFRQTSAWVGVKRTGGSNSVVMTNGLTMDNNWNTTSTGTEVESVSVSGSQIWLRATADIQTGSGRQANFSYSTDGKTFTTIGNNLTLNNEWQFFMGYRFAIFNFTTTSTGGLVKVESFEETTP
ncbi:MAG: family 43 glycosylhydrolase, partial [Deltaproteobacteria bacterium]|nr:family 43 glycosylhydrolase [Deltaproteobacteria bacterium]